MNTFREDAVVTVVVLILRFFFGPKILQEKYQVAAQNTLNACYRECLQLLAESELKTVAIPCFWYSRLEGNHVKFERVHPPKSNMDILIPKMDKHVGFGHVSPFKNGKLFWVSELNFCGSIYSIDFS